VVHLQNIQQNSYDENNGKATQLQKMLRSLCVYVIPLRKCLEETCPATTKFFNCEILLVLSPAAYLHNIPQNTCDCNLGVVS
jgi:hypothetical protein